MRSSGEVPGRTHRFLPPASDLVVFPFGHGLSYERWAWAWDEGATEAAPAAAGGGPCNLSLALALTLGAPAMRGSLSVLLFLRPPPSAGAAAPWRELRRFARLDVDAAAAQGRTARLAFALDRGDFELADARGAWRLVPGNWTAEVSEPAALRRTLVVEPSGACRAA